LATIFCQLVGAALIIDGRGFGPIATGQYYADWDCDPATNPCTTCAQTLRDWQCVLNLQGWSWGGCYTPFGTGCNQSSSACGVVYDCSTPPNPIGGNGCNTVFDTCT